LSDDNAQERFYFATNSHTYFRTGADFYWRNDTNQSLGSVSATGQWTFGGAQGSDYSQTSYAVQVQGPGGLNVRSTQSALVNGQRDVVLRASGDKLWIDQYGIFRRNRQSLNESITVSNIDNCMSAGPITINPGITVTIEDTGSWTIV